MTDNMNYRERAAKIFLDLQNANILPDDNTNEKVETVVSTKKESKKQEAKPVKVKKARKVIRKKAIDVSELTDNKKIVNAIRKMNPKAIIKMDNTRKTLFVSVPGKRLLLPIGLSRENNSIVNKDKSFNFEVKDLAYINEKDYREAVKEEKKQAKAAKKVTRARKGNKKAWLWGLLIAGGLITAGVITYKSGVIQHSIIERNEKSAEFNHKMAENSKKEHKNYMPETSENIEIDIKEQQTSEEDVPFVDGPAPSVEYISDELLQSGYNFKDITPEYLKSINPELSKTTAWIEVPGTKINNVFVFPNVDAIDSKPGLIDDIEKSKYDKYEYFNNYYLKHDLAGNETEWGTLYQDVYSVPLNNHTSELADMNIIYGHHMQDGSMFTGLDKWKKDKDGSYNAEHPFGVIYTDDGLCYKLTFVTSMVINGDEDQLYAGNFADPSQKQAYINSIIEKAKKDGIFTLDEYNINEDTKFMSLVTCSYARKNDRYVLIGVLEKQAIRDIELDGYEIRKEKER